MTEDAALRRTGSHWLRRSLRDWATDVSPPVGLLQVYGWMLGECRMSRGHERSWSPTVESQLLYLPQCVKLLGCCPQSLRHRFSFLTNWSLVNAL